MSSSNQRSAGAIPFCFPMRHNPLSPRPFAVCTRTNGHRGLTPILFYLYAEPGHWSATRRPVDERAKARHREELKQCAATVAGDDTRCLACPYRHLFEAWTNSRNGDIRAHAHAVDSRFSP